MKRILLASTALVAVVLSESAAAAEWEAGISGDMSVGFALTDSDTQDGIGVLRDGEVHFNARLTADNGITFVTRVELEAFSEGAGDQIDENWVRVLGSFGTITIGGQGTVGYEQVEGYGMLFAPGRATVGYADGEVLVGATLNGAGEQASVGIYDDGIGVHYSTPDILGFQLHASYLPSLSADGPADSNNYSFDAGDEVWSLAASYYNDFESFSVGLGAHYSDVEGVSGEQIGVAGNVAVAGFTLAGFFEDDFDGDEWGIGVQYATGPWTVGGGYADSHQLDNQIAAAWVGYDLAPGVVVAGGVEWADEELGTADEDFGGAVWMSVNF